MSRPTGWSVTSQVLVFVLVLSHGLLLGQDGHLAHNLMMWPNPREQSQVLLNGQQPVHKPKPERI